MNENKLHRSFESYQNWIDKYLPNEESYSPSDLLKLEKETLIPVFLEFDSFKNLEIFLEENNFEILHVFNHLPILWINVSYSSINDITEKDSILKIYGNHQMYLCQDSYFKDFKLNEIHDSFLEFTGKGVKIGLIDSGIDGIHPDLAGKIIDNLSINITDEESGDLNGHGTFMAGILCGSGEMSEYNYKGVAPDAKLINIKTFNKLGKSTIGDILKSLDKLLGFTKEEIPDILIFSCSTGIIGSNDDLLSKYCKLFFEKNISIIAPTGNLGPDPGNIGSPGMSPYVLTVGGLKNYSKPAFFSGCGLVAIEDQDLISKPDIILPSSNIISTKAKKGILGMYHEFYSNYVTLSGTSCSVAIAGGLMALLKQIFPNLTTPEMYALIKSETIKLDVPVNIQGAGIPQIKKILRSKNVLYPKQIFFSNLIKLSLIFSSLVVMFVFALIFIF